MEPAESSVETLSETEGLAEVVIESEPAPGGAQTLFEQRDGRWVGNVEGSEMELSMQDEQVLASVLSLGLGDPAIVNTAEGVNLNGDPVTWTAIYERTDAGIMTTHLEEARDVPREFDELQPVEYEDDSVGPELTAFPKPETIFESRFFGSEAEAESPAQGKLWFERDLPTSNESQQDSNAGADIIDFFSRGHLFEPKDSDTEIAATSLFQPELHQPADSEDRSNVIEAIFGQAGAVDSEANEPGNAGLSEEVVEESQAHSNVVELFVGGVELVDEPNPEVHGNVVEDAEATDIKVEDADIDEEAAEAQSVPVLADSLGAPVEIVADSDDTRVDQILAVETEEVLEAKDVNSAVEHQPEAILITDTFATVAEITKPSDVHEEIPAIEEVPLTAAPEQSIQFVEAEPDGAEIADILETPPVEELLEVNDTEDIRSPVLETQLTGAPDELVDEPHEAVLDLSAKTESADIPISEDIEEPKRQTIEEVIQAVDSDQPEVISSNDDSEELVEADSEPVPTAAFQPEIQPDAFINESQNVIRLETSEPDDLDLSASDWAAEFGPPSVEAVEQEPVTTPQEPKREIRISRHESGMLDITVTFETAAEAEEQVRTRAKKTAPKTLRRAA